MDARPCGYKTILVHVEADAAADARVRLALAVARAADAHLVGCALTGISHFVTPAMAAAGDARLAARCAALRDAAAAALRRFDALVRAAGHGGPDRRDDLAEYLLLASARPVLVVPPALRGPALDGPALVAWDGSVEATRAVTAALPLLRAARGVTVVGFRAVTDRADDGDPCARLAAWLGRHGVAAQTAQAGRHAAADDVGAALLSTAADLDATLLVMGGYGHARYRELLLGGVTATILRALTLPVLLAH